MGDSAFDRGMAVRRQVLGDEFVEAAFRKAEDSRFGTAWQEFVTAQCWGQVWARPGLTPKIRSLVTIAMLAALGRGDELVGHLRGATRNGCTEEEIREVLLQVAVYAGVPAGSAAFRAAEEAI